jgi:hypothetical protein
MTSFFSASPITSDSHLCDTSQVPCPTGADTEQHLTNREVLELSKQRYTGTVPSNLFILNDEEDCVRMLCWLRNSSILTEGKVPATAAFQNSVLFL